MARGKDLSDSERGFIVGAQMAGASVTNAAQLTSVSIGTVTKVTSVSVEKISVNRVRNCGRQHTFNECYVHAVVQYFM